MPAARNQDVTVRRPLAKRIPYSNKGRRTALRRSSQWAKSRKALATKAGRGNNGMAGSLTRVSLSRVIVFGEPAFDHSPESFRQLHQRRMASGTTCRVDKKCDGVAESTDPALQPRV